MLPLGVARVVGRAKTLLRTAHTARAHPPTPCAVEEGNRQAAN